MKSVLIIAMLITSVMASAALEVPYDRNDSLPTDQTLANGVEVRSKVVSHAGTNYIIMYKATWGQAPLATQVVGVCSIQFRDSIEQCIADKTPVLAEVAKANIKGPLDCSKVARTNHDHARTVKRITDFNAIANRRDTETNVRDLSTILSSLNFQNDALNSQIGNFAVTQRITKTKQLLDLVANKSIRLQDAPRALMSEITASGQLYTGLLGETQCTEEQLKMCYVQKGTNTILTPNVNVEKYNEFMNLHKQGLVEMAPCQSVLQPQIQPVIEVPQVKPVEQQTQIQPVVEEAVNPIQ